MSTLMLWRRSPTTWTKAARTLALACWVLCPERKDVSMNLIVCIVLLPITLNQEKGTKQWIVQLDRTTICCVLLQVYGSITHVGVARNLIGPFSFLMTVAVSTRASTSVTVTMSRLMKGDGHAVGRLEQIIFKILILTQYELYNGHKFVFSIQPLAKFAMSRSQIFTNHNSPLIKTSDGSLVVSTKAGRNCFATRGGTKKKKDNFVILYLQFQQNSWQNYNLHCNYHVIGRFWLEKWILGNIRTGFFILMDGKIFASKNIPLSTHTVKETFDILYILLT